MGSTSSLFGETEAKEVALRPLCAVKRILFGVKGLAGDAGPVERESAEARIGAKGGL